MFGEDTTYDLTVTVLCHPSLTQPGSRTAAWSLRSRSHPQLNGSIVGTEGSELMSTHARSLPSVHGDTSLQLLISGVMRLRAGDFPSAELELARLGIVVQAT
jgi:hypothetical protein